MDQWCKSFKGSVAGLGIAGVVLSGSLVAAPTARADEFEAFTWARHHPAATEHVTPMIQVDPWVDLADVARRLKMLPEGKRFIVFQWMADDLADNPADRVLHRSWELRPAPAPVSAPASRAAISIQSASVKPVAVKGGSSLVMASSGRAPGSSGKGVSVAAPASVVMTRVAVDRPTQFRGPWMDAGIATVRARVEATMRRLKALDVTIDGVAVANETTLHAANFMGTPGSLAAIEQDPRWPALAAAMRLPARVSGMWWGDPLYQVWTERMSARFDAAMNQAVFMPIRQAYPRAVVSNYMSGRVLAAYATPDVNGHLDRSATTGFGTHDNTEFYGWLSAGRIDRTRGSIPISESWLAFRVEIHKIRGMNASSRRPKHAWIASRSWQGEPWGPVPFAGTQVWDELVLQLGMHGVRQFFELSIEDFGISREQNLERRWNDRVSLDAALGELNARISGASPMVLGAHQPSWNDRVIATGRVVGDRVVWRFSFAEGIDAVRIRLSDGSQHVVEAEAGRRGAWFEHPEGMEIEMESAGRMPAMEVVDAGIRLAAGE